MREDPFRLTARPDAIEARVNAEGDSVFLCLRTTREDINHFNYIQLHLTPEQADNLIENLQAATQEARTYGFVAWIQQTSPDLWARWIVGPRR